MFRLNFKIAFRSLWRNKGFSLINIGGLAIGLACCLLLLLYVHYEFSYDQQFKNANKTYILKLNTKNNNQVITEDASPPALTEVAMQNIPGIAYISRVSLAESEGKRLYSQQENKFKLHALWVDSSFLKIFDYHFIYGNSATALNNPDAAVLTATTSKRLFGTKILWGKPSSMIIASCFMLPVS
jgi:putative ABC transport system permease protein